MRLFDVPKKEEEDEESRKRREEGSSSSSSSTSSSSTTSNNSATAKNIKNRKKRRRRKENNNEEEANNPQPIRNGFIVPTSNKRSRFKGKKFPVTPTTKMYPAKEEEGGEEAQKMRRESDIGLVDYDDFGTSSSSSSSSSSGRPSPLRNFQDILSSSSKKPFGAGSANDSLNNLISDDKHDDNVPCSSSSLRERLHSQSTPSTSKVASKTSSKVPTVVYEEESIPPPTTPSSLKEEEGKLEEGDPYLYSGIGRHFGKKRSPSSCNLTDGDSVSGVSVGGGVPGGGGNELEWLGWLMRLKAVTMVLFGTSFILSLSSLLFVFPIIVDPILLGIQAQFSLTPVTCRTTLVRNGTGATECALPSCRAGCTADIFQCIFIQVNYTLEAFISSDNSSSPHDNHLSTLQEKTVVTKNATLFININGCGFPPSVNCTTFLKLYGKVGSSFGCFYSGINDSFVVPYYNLWEEESHLYSAILIPILLAFFSFIILFLTIKCCNVNRGGGGIRNIINKSPSQIKLLEKEGESVRKLNGSVGNNVNGKIKRQRALTQEDEFFGEGPYMNGKANGHVFQETITNLMGMQSPTDLHKQIQKLPSHPSISPHQRRKYVKKNEQVKGEVFNVENETNLFSKSKTKLKEKSVKDTF